MGTVPTRPWRAEALACLADHAPLRELLSGARDINPREQYLLGVAQANLGDLPAARRALRGAISAGYHDAIVHRSLRQVDEGRQDIPYFAMMELASPATAALMRRVITTGAGGQELRERLEQDPGLADLIDRLLQEEPGAALQLYAAAGAPETLEKIQQFAANEANGYTDRILALSLLRDAGQIAEDEPVELVIDGQPISIKLGRRRIVPERPIIVPDDHAARLFEEGAGLAEADPEAAYNRWVAFNEYYPQSVSIKIRLSQISQALGRPEESRDWLEQALALDPDAVEAHIGLAALSLNEGDLPGAIAHSRAVDDTGELTASELLSYQSVQEGLSALLESPLADALMSQADLADDEESAEANRELAGVLGAMQKSMALTQYLRQRPVANLREDLSLREVMLQLDDTVIYNAAWLFGLIDELEAAAEEASGGGTATADGVEEEEGGEEEESYPPAARELLARELLSPERLITGLPGLPDRDLQALEWLLEGGGAAPLEEYLAAFPGDDADPSDMLLEYGIVAEGRLSGRLTRMIPADLRAPLEEALRLRDEW